jgi:twitching motility protein PilT
MDQEFKRLIEIMVEKNAADLVFAEGQPAMMRVADGLVPAGGRKLNSDDILGFARQVLSPDLQKKFESELEVDASFGLEGVARLRVNVFKQRGAIGMVIRLLPYKIPDLDSLGVPESIKEWLMFPHGIIVTTGPTGSGKSTTQAAMIDFLNQRQKSHVITIEDPVEFVHPNMKCTIEQREVGRDTHSFANALRSVFRQAPDVIMVGEIRDLETMEATLRLAETGHLVLATLHTGDATQAISRIVDVFPQEQQQQVRVQLSLVLIGVLVQQLVPRVDGKGRVLVTEVLRVNSGIRNLIRKNELQQIYSVIQTSSSEQMTTMNMSLTNLYKEGKISKEQAMLFTTRHKELETMMEKERVLGGEVIRPMAL